MGKMSFAILTVSDTCSAGTATDASGPHLQNLIQKTFKTDAIKYEIVPDDIDKIEGALRFFCDVLNINVIFTTGGTGFSPRDVTPEATKRLIERETPQLTLGMSLCSYEKTKYAALSRAVSGIRKQSLIVNFPGSKKAVDECFGAIASVIAHAVDVIRDEVPCVRETHKVVQKGSDQSKMSDVDSASPFTVHICPHKTGSGLKDDRNSPYPMIEVDEALRQVFGAVSKPPLLKSVKSDMNLPPFRASIKDGYAVKSSGGPGSKTVIGYISAGDPLISTDFQDNACYKINTGAAVPDAADCIIQVEDTQVLQEVDGIEKVIKINTTPTSNLDIRPIGCDLRKNDYLFSGHGSSNFYYPGDVAWNSLLASIGKKSEKIDVSIGIISTGDELTEPGQKLNSGKIYDTNTTMLRELLLQFGFRNIKSTIAADSYESLSAAMKQMTEECNFTICTGGVSMGDKDFVKKVLADLDFQIIFGRVNMKPGKPMTFASSSKGKCVFGLPGNPVSAFVTFHLFVLPALRYSLGYSLAKCQMSAIQVELINEKLELDPRPEYVRATVTSKGGKLYAEVTGDQISSRLKSIDGADVLLHLPGRSKTITSIKKGSIIKASVLKNNFISKIE